jgi:Fe-S cluster assembly protein SufD
MDGSVFLDAARAALPADERDQRAAALARFAAGGLPGPALESWHYSDWTHLAERRFVTAPLSPTPAFPHDAAQPLRLSTLDPVQCTTRFALDDLNRALATEGVEKTLEGQAQRPFLIAQWVDGPQAMHHLRHQLKLAADASATVLLWDAPGSGDHDTLLTAVMTLELAARSQLTLIRVQQADAAATRALHLAATVAADASLQLVELHLGGARVRQEVEVTLAAPGARFEQTGLTALKGKSRVDQRSHVWHAAPHCTSVSHARLLAAEGARAVLNAKVQVQPGAQKTDSETRIASLLLSDKAEIDAKPELEIYADDVKCAHGASFGQLSAEAAFYLRSRGLSATEAQSLLTQAFAQAALDALPLPGLKAWAEGEVRALLAGATS